MASITSESRAEFFDKSKKVKEAIKSVQDKEKNILNMMKKDTVGKEYKKILLAEEMMYIATLYMAINSLSLKILNTKNNDALNDARKAIYKSIIYLEEIVSNTVDCPFRELEPKLATISNTPIERRFYLVRKLGLAIQMLTDAFGDNTKWKWSFVELRGRYTTVAKNMIDMKQAAKDYFDPASPDYDNSVLYVRLLRKLIDKSAVDYRDKYELSTRRTDDMRTAINYCIANRRIAMVLGDDEDSEEIRKKALSWKTKMEDDVRKGTSN